MVSTLRSTCQSLLDGVTSSRPLLCHLNLITSCSLPALVASKPRTHALISRVSSLSIIYRHKGGAAGVQNATPRLQALHCPSDASRSLFSSLSTLRAVFECDGKACPAPVGQGCLLQLLQLLAADAASFSSLRRLDVEDHGLATREEFELSFSSLQRLLGLTHCRLLMQTVSTSSCSSLLSTLSSMQSVTSLDLGEEADRWPQLLPLLCAEAATPLLLRLKSLALPGHCKTEGRFNKLHDTFLCRLSSLPAPPVLQCFSAMPVSYRAAGLLSVFSLPHLTVLKLGGAVGHRELLDFVSNFTSAASPLVSLDFPISPIETARAVSGQLLSRFTTLRRLRCDGDIASGAKSCGSLYSLSVLSCPRPGHLPLTPPLSFPLLTELTLPVPMQDEELRSLLSACPQLLVLDCEVSQSWNVVTIAAHCCPRLMHLAARIRADRRCGPASRCCAASPFLPQLITLRLTGGQSGRQSSFDSDLSVLQHFTAPPHAELRHVRLVSPGLTAQRVLPLSCLPRLTYLHASNYCDDVGGEVAELEEAKARAVHELASRGAYRRAYPASPRPVAFEGEDWESRVKQRTLGPHQQQEMRLRVLKEAAARHEAQADNLLASVRGVKVDEDAARAVFFAELRSVLSARLAG